jgi:flagellar basal body-associated protein FliL
MQTEHQKRIIIAKRIIIVVLVVVALISVGIGVALLLKNIVGKATESRIPSSSDNQNIVPTAPSAASVIEGYTSLGTIRAFAENYQVQQDTSAPSSIMYKADDQRYAVNVTTSHYALFYASKAAQQNDAVTILTQTTNYMQGKGFKKAQVSSDPSTAVYTQLGAVCQLTSAPTSVPPYYLIACADKADVQKEYSKVEDLLALYKKSHQLDSFTKAISSTVTAGNKSMTTVALTTAHQHPVLLFAAVNDKWSYLGDLGGGTAATSNGKYSISTEIQSAIRDPRYGDFLTRNLQ